MNSPPRPSRTMAHTRRVVGSYNRSYNGKSFVPLRMEKVGGFNCVIVMPEDDSFFYRMDKRKPFAFEGETGNAVFGAERNSYFGIQPSDIMNAYKTHTHLYVVNARTPIVLIDMGNLENIRLLLSELTPKEIRLSVSLAFPIKEDGLVHRYSVPARDHNDGIDHDRRILEYLCSLPGMDGYYVSVDGLHPEIGFCRGSLAKLNVVDMFRIRAEEQPRGRPGPRNGNKSGTKRRNRSPNNQFPSLRRRFMMNENNSGPPRFSFGNRLGFEGGKRRRKTQHKHRK